ncbi:acyl-[acyl-carrier-protein]--UDP-N-acetylglucosamine O-acyltransferase [Malonomonas rubra DSM 5091]|uniref:Acyl-[acyl-carrier-protein]--UDP-N-acetylglucosamine O-acyltransferase n=1 Tax=Malonomonas rubra DSM 5091 TaxID=1122189 RepID=A0A1M6C8L8_MALRU|nr:acyl-ACP--UDP-N-acetylglucosamine O-acyltransferase [Malonomonas rubra]SHI57382.1 acyl-[acyl-carrier-protein]--UDP-N-acetylglucosamine O-acyltransferase [Malonomonas rubra DSM 5091]
MIHPTAIIAPGAKLDSTVSVGPYAVIGENVSIGAGTTVGPHAVIEGRTEIGEENQIFQFASVGAVPQDLKFHGEESTLQIGDRNKIREFVTIHLGTEDGGGVTTVGSDNLLMAYSHVAHDCIVKDHVILANGATLAGHVEVDEFAILGGLSAVHQFTRIGCHVMASGGSMIAQDVAPYSIVQGDRATTVGVNLTGLKRRGYSSEALSNIKKMYKLVFRSNLKLEEAIVQIEADLNTDADEVATYVAFLKKSTRGLAR